MEDKTALLKEWIDGSNNIVFFGGAGVSTESGVPDFRSTDGLYNQEYAYPPEVILSRGFFMKNTKEFYRFYKEKLLFKGIEPNITHRKLAEWEAQGRLKAVVTQNIDCLHHMAGSKEVLELHGTITRNYCMNCKKQFPFDYIIESEDVPHCDNCGGVIKPDVVLYEESLNDGVLMKAIKYISEAEVLIVAGTSLSVYPAAGLINYYSGNKLVLINKTPTEYDGKANMVINAGLGEIFSLL